MNVRNPKDEFTAYSFPSKTIEYMSSGTPLLTSHLPGIPQEYFDFCYSISGNDVTDIKSALETIMGYSDEVRRDMGQRAREDVYKRQGWKLTDIGVQNHIWIRTLSLRMLTLG